MCLLAALCTKSEKSSRMSGTRNDMNATGVLLRMMPSENANVMHSVGSGVVLQMGSGALNDQNWNWNRYLTPIRN